MRLMVDKLMGDAQITFYNKAGEVIHVEFISGKVSSGTYEQVVPVSEIEYGHTMCVVSGTCEYRVIV